MLPIKIKLTEQIINDVKTARTAKRIPASSLSRAINRDDSYISSLELGRLRTISAVDLVAMLRCIFGVSEQEATGKAEALVALESLSGSYTRRDSQHSVLREPHYGYGDQDADSVREAMAEYPRFGADTDYAGPELISDMLDALAGLIIDFYKKDPKEAVFVLNSFVKLMRLDPRFAMGMMGMPFSVLKNLRPEQRKTLLAELSTVFKQYAAAARINAGTHNAPTAEAAPENEDT